MHSYLKSLLTDTLQHEYYIKNITSQTDYPCSVLTHDCGVKYITFTSSHHVLTPGNKPDSWIPRGIVYGGEVGNPAMTVDSKLQISGNALGKPTQEVFPLACSTDLWKPVCCLRCVLLNPCPNFIYLSYLIYHQLPIQSFNKTKLLNEKQLYYIFY